MFVLKVGCLRYCPHSFLHCFEAPGLPKSTARQIRSEASKTTLRSSHVLFLRRDLGLSSCSLLNISHVVSYLLFFFLFICFAISVSHCWHPETTHSVFKDTSNTLCFSISLTVRRTPYSTRTPVFCSLPSGNNSPSSQSVALCLFVVTWTQRCVCGSSIGGFLFLICSSLL